MVLFTMASRNKTSHPNQTQPNPIQPNLASGMVIAVKGTVKASGEMLVEDWCAAGLPPPVPPPSQKVITP